MDAPRITLADTPDFDLGGLRVSPGRRQVRMDDARRDLEPKVALVLVALASARPGVVSRDRLIEECWDGRIVGGWGQRPDGEVVTRLLEDIGRDGTAAVAHEAERLTTWLGGVKVVPRFRCPLERELSA